MKRYEIGQRIKVEFNNDFHNTTAVGIATITRTDTDEIFAKISYPAARRIEKKLCGMSDCLCGTFRGKHQVQATGKRIYIEEPANRCGSNVGGQRPENPMRLIIKK